MVKEYEKDNLIKKEVTKKDEYFLLMFLNFLVVGDSPNRINTYL